VTRNFCLFFAAMTLTVLPAAALAQKQQAPNPEALLQQAEKYYEQLEYETALKTLIMVHQVTGASPMQKARSFLYMGVCFTALGNAENAVLAFMELLKLKNNFRLPPGISPSIKAMFAEALKRLKFPAQPPPGPPQGGPGGQPGPGGQKIPVAIEAKAPEKQRAGSSVEVKIEVADPRRLVQKLTLRWRRVGGGDFSTVKVPYKPGTKVIKAKIPGALVGKKEGKLLFFVEAHGRGDMTLAHAGAMDEPFKIKLTGPPKKKSNWGWWALGVGGALAVAGGVVAAVLLTQDDDNGIVPNTADVTITIH
jgi:hypothetical protein